MNQSKDSQGKSTPKKSQPQPLKTGNKTEEPGGWIDHEKRDRLDIEKRITGEQIDTEKKIKAKKPKASKKQSKQ